MRFAHRHKNTTEKSVRSVAMSKEKTLKELNSESQTTQKKPFNLKHSNGSNLSVLKTQTK